MADQESVESRIERLMMAIMNRNMATGQTPPATPSPGPNGVCTTVVTPAPSHQSTTPLVPTSATPARRGHNTFGFKGHLSYLRGKTGTPKTRVGPYPTAPVKTRLFIFYVLPTPSTTTPKGGDELVHAQAGLGRRQVALPEEGSHQEIEDILHTEYPKLKQLKGGWMFYKAQGGSGRRRIDPIPTGIPGYSTTSVLKDHSGNGKRCVYIAPLQEGLSTEPLPPDAPEFASMPKAACQKCWSMLPLQLLALHVQDCKNISEEAIDTDTEMEQEDTIQLQGDDGCQVCPVCQVTKPSSIIHIHASRCVDRLSREQDDAGMDGILLPSSSPGLEDPVTPSLEDSLPGSSRVPFPRTSRDPLPGTSYDSLPGTSYDSLPGSSRDPFPGTSYDSPGTSAPSQLHLPGTLSSSTQDLSPPGQDDERPESPFTAWTTAVDPEMVCYLFTKELRDLNTGARAMRLTLDVTETPDEQDATLITFYKSRGNQWASPFMCRLQGDHAVGAGVRRHVLSTVMNKVQNGFHLSAGQEVVTRLFDGEADHLVPSAAPGLTESELFVMAGRMIGHTFLHGGPALTGLSPAIVNILTGGTMDTAAALLTINDCPDLEYRDIMQPLEKDFSDITTEEQENVRTQCGIWDCLSFVHLTAKNKDRVFQDLLVYAVLKRTVLEVKQLRKGLKDTGIWPLIKTRPDIVPLLFPRESERQLDAQMIIQNIRWPLSREAAESDDDDDDRLSAEVLYRITGFFRKFLEEASTSTLRDMLKFWTGWEVPDKVLKLEIGHFAHPTSATCFETLKLPCHYESAEKLQEDLLMCLRNGKPAFSTSLKSPLMDANGQVSQLPVPQPF